MSKEIKGTIEYTIRVLEDGSFETEYNQSIENQMASMCISQHTLEQAIASISLQKKEAKGPVKKSLSNQLTKFTQARFGIAMLADLVYGSYDSYKEYKEKHDKEMLTAEVTEKDIEVMNKLKK
jgi:hypothetical protein